MKVQTDMQHVFAAALLAAASAMAGAQNGTDAPSAAAQHSNDALVAPAAAREQAREIAHGDPARWHREDTTAQQRARTRQKEIGAALAEAKSACRQAPPAQRPGCLKEAQDTWKEEMAGARAEASMQPGTRTR